MKKLAIAFAVGAAALLGGSAAKASDDTVKTKAITDVTQPTSVHVAGTIATMDIVTTAHITLPRAIRAMATLPGPTMVADMATSIAAFTVGRIIIAAGTRTGHNA